MFAATTSNFNFSCILLGFLIAITNISGPSSNIELLVATILSASLYRIMSVYKIEFDRIAQAMKSLVVSSGVMIVVFWLVAHVMDVTVQNDDGSEHLVKAVLIFGALVMFV
jgi:hypothetical protein